jgi:hypothetical protein
MIAKKQLPVPAESKILLAQSTRAEWHRQMPKAASTKNYTPTKKDMAVHSAPNVAIAANPRSVDSNVPKEMPSIALQLTFSSMKQITRQLRP